MPCWSVCQAIWVLGQRSRFKNILAVTTAFSGTLICSLESDIFLIGSTVKLGRAPARLSRNLAYRCLGRPRGLGTGTPGRRGAMSWCSSSGELSRKDVSNRCVLLCTAHDTLSGAMSDGRRRGVNLPAGMAGMRMSARGRAS